MKANPNPCHDHKRLGRHGFRKSMFTKLACENFYVQRISKMTFMLASLFSPSAVFKPQIPATTSATCDCKRFALSRYTHATLIRSVYSIVTNRERFPVESDHDLVTTYNNHFQQPTAEYRLSPITGSYQMLAYFTTRICANFETLYQDAFRINVQALDRALFEVTSSEEVFPSPQFLW
jgi:hypothetical protein